MKKHVKVLGLAAAAASVLAIGSLTGCEKKEETKAPTPPVKAPAKPAAPAEAPK